MQDQPGRRLLRELRARLLPGGYLVVLGLLLLIELAGTIAASGWVSSRNRETTHRLFEADGVAVAQQLQNTLIDYAWAIDGLRLRFRSRNFDAPAMQRAAEDARVRLVAIQSIGIIGANGRAYWRIPATEEQLTEPALSADNPAWAAALRTVREQGRAAITGWLMDQRWRNVIGVVVPMHVERDASARGDPLVFVALDGPVLFSRGLGQDTLEKLDIDVYANNQFVAHLGGSASRDDHQAELQSVSFYGESYELRIWPTQSYLSAHGDSPTSARWILLLGIPTALLTTGLLHQLISYRLRSLRDERHYSAALESLTEVGTALSSRLGAGQEALQQLADAARKLMSMTFSSVSELEVREGEESVIHIRALGGRIPPQVPRIWNLSEVPVSRRCIESGEVVLVDDARVVEGMNRAALKHFGLIGIIAIPLKLGERRMGVITLGDDRPRKFTDADRRLARLLGSQAAVILTNNSLYEKSRGEAASNAILLRELHHRVKNNLAGIVGLLSAEPPGVNDTSRQWLARVVGRIRTMAAAHELFTSAIGQIGLNRLIDQVLPTLSVIQPGGVMVRTVIEGEEPQFATARAVTLAMVLHELCFNAIEHGTGIPGVVTIRARRLDDQIVIDVIDTGRPDADQVVSSRVPDGRHAMLSDSQMNADLAPAALLSTVQAGSSPHGLGLRLVRELVSRELRGSFRLRIVESGGAVATVQFPANNDSSRP